MVTMHDVVVSAVSAAVAAAMRIRRIASQTEFFFMVIIFLNHGLYGLYGFLSTSLFLWLFFNHGLFFFEPQITQITRIHVRFPSKFLSNISRISEREATRLSNAMQWVCFLSECHTSGSSLLRQLLFSLGTPRSVPL